MLSARMHPLSARALRAKRTIMTLTALLMVVGLLARPAPALAAGAITVDTFADDFGDDSATCSLREAIEAVNLHSDFGGCLLTGTAPFTIELAAGTYTLTREGAAEDANATGDLDILAPLALRGMGAEMTFIQAGETLEEAIDRVFQIMPSAEADIAGVTIQYGMPPMDENGGGIANQGTLMLNASAVTMNRSNGDEAGEGGGGIYNAPNSYATIMASTITQNQATTELGNGGGIFNDGNAVLMVVDSLIGENAAARAGGGIENFGGFVTLEQTMLNANTAGVNGGGLHISGAGTVAMMGGEAVANVADAEGGGLWNSAGGALTIMDSTIAGNSAAGADADQGGGGLFSDGGMLAVVNTKVMSNTATGAAGSGGGILVVPGSTLHVDGGAISENQAMRAGGGVEVNGTPEMMVHALLENVEMADNSVGDAPGNGGALHITGAAAVTVRNATVMENMAAAEGGGLWNSAAGALTVIDSTLTGNTAAGVDADQGGGALFTDGGMLTVIDSIITGNVATGVAGSGGGILATVGSTLYVTGGAISENSAMRAGGGVEINAAADAIASASLDGVEMIGNMAGSAPGNGGALHITGPGEVMVRNALITENSAAAEGGGLWNSAVGALTVVDSTFMGNIASGDDADQGGGALFNDGGMLHVTSSTVRENMADGEAGSGGGLLATVGSTVTVMDSDFSGNQSMRAGGAVEINGSIEATATVTIHNVNFMENSTGEAPGNGGAVHVTGQANVTIVGGTATDNAAAAEGGAFWNSAVGAMRVEHVLLSGNTAGGADADQGGGALFNDGGTLSVLNATLVENMATGAAGSGGAILAAPGSMLEVSGGMLRGNAASRAGGAIEVNGTMTDTVAAMLNGVQMVENTTGVAPGNGGALHITGVAEVAIMGGTVISNTAAAEGGGLWNSGSGTLNVDGVRISGNTASGADADQGGGGLFNDGGAMMVTNAVVRGNVADGEAGSGGGILNNMGVISITYSTIAGNVSNRAGGGIEVNGDSLTQLEQVRLLRNSTGDAPGNGGGLHITGAGRVEVARSTVAENTAAAEGGGLWNSAIGTLMVADSTFNKNTTTASGDDQGGGALFNDGGIFTISNSSVTGNAASNDMGSGLLNAAGTSTLINLTVTGNAGTAVMNAANVLNIFNSIVAANAADCSGTISTSDAPNLDGDGSCGASLTGDPMLAMLARNGGPTATMALVEGSPAVDAGDDALCGAALVDGLDQRGAARPAGAACDLGAFELGAMLSE